MTPLGDMRKFGLSTKGMQALLRSGVSCVEDIAKLRRVEVGKIRGIGEKALGEIDEAMKGMGFKYRGES